MVIYSTLKSIYFLIIAYIADPTCLKSYKKWILPLVCFWAFDLLTSYLQVNFLVMPLAITLLVIPSQIWLIKTLFKYSIEKAYVFKLFSMIVFFIIPEMILPIPIYLISIGLDVQSRLDMSVSLFTYIPSMFLLYYFRSTVQKIMDWFGQAPDLLISACLVVALNMDWYMTALASTTFDQSTFHSDVQMIYTIIIGLFVINFFPSYLIFKKIRQANKESQLHNIEIAKDMLSDYLSQVHDLRNVAQVLQVCETEGALENTCVVNRMIALKNQKANRHKIQILMPSLNTITSNSSNDLLHPFLDSLNTSIVVGILLDNAIEHLSDSPALDKIIHIHWDAALLKLAISNPITPKGSHLLRHRTKGETSKPETLLSGFGLSNAYELAQENNAKIDMALTDHSVTFSLIG